MWSDLPTASMDRELIGRVLHNLLSNALKYMRAGGYVALWAACHGRIWLDSQPGQGSIFSFTLPLDSVQAGNNGDAHEGDVTG